MYDHICKLGLNAIDLVTISHVRFTGLTLNQYAADMCAARNICVYMECVSSLTTRRSPQQCAQLPSQSGLDCRPQVWKILKAYE